MPDVRDLELNKVKLLTSVSSKRGTGNLTSKQMKEQYFGRGQRIHTHIHTHTHEYGEGRTKVSVVSLPPIWPPSTGYSPAIRGIPALCGLSHIISITLYDCKYGRSVSV